MYRFIVKNTHELNVLPGFRGRFYRPNALACDCFNLRTLSSVKVDGVRSCGKLKADFPPSGFFLGRKVSVGASVARGFRYVAVAQGRRFHFGRLTLNSA